MSDIFLVRPEMSLCGSQEAKDFLEKLILNKKVKISSTANDIFKRLVSDVYLDGASVNNQMVASGWAAYDSSDSADVKIMMESGENARKNKIGIYSEKCSQTVPSNVKCRIKANINDASGVKMYYPPDCGGRYDADTIRLPLIFSAGINGFVPKKRVGQPEACPASFLIVFQ